MECPQLWSLGKAIFHISMDMETQGIAITSRAIMGIMVDTTATTIDEWTNQSIWLLMLFL